MSIKLPGIHLPLRGPETAVPAPRMHLLQAAHRPAGRPELKRRHIWELANIFHCSVIGTCLTTTELRQILLKAKLPGVEKETDHELHARAVLLALQVRKRLSGRPFASNKKTRRRDGRVFLAGEAGCPPTWSAPHSGS